MTMATWKRDNNRHNSIVSLKATELDSIRSSLVIGESVVEEDEKSSEESDYESQSPPSKKNPPHS